MAQTEIVQDERRLKQRAMRRLAIALVLIAVAIAGLALLDRYNAALKKPQVPPAPAQPRVLGTPAPPTPAAAEKPPPPPPVVSNQPLPQEASEPAAARSPSVDPPTAPTPASPQSPLVSPASPSAVEPAPYGTVSPAQTAAATEPEKTPSPAPAAQPAHKGFVVQVGVFTSPENARALENRLAQSGIRARIETRVVVGPFADRAEADAVIAQLKGMGLQAMVLGSH